MNEVCRTFSERHLGSYGLQTIGIYLSSVECIQDNLRDTINGILKKYSLPHSCISIEITETAAGQASESFNTNIQALSQDGYSICLDNLGTGNTSLKKLMSIPFNIIKIDKSIVDNYLRDETEGFISSLSKLIHSLNMAITVEGVEEEWQFKTLKKWKFDYIQGFLFSRPLNGEEAGRFIPQKID